MTAFDETADSQSRNYPSCLSSLPGWAFSEENLVCMKPFSSGIIVQKNMLTMVRRSIEAETVKRHLVKLKGELIEFLDHDFMFEGKKKSNLTSVLSF